MFRRILSLVLSLCIMLTSMPALSVYALAESDEEAIVEVVSEETEKKEEPTPEPTKEPTPEPTKEPTPEPTKEPTPEPTEEVPAAEEPEAPAEEEQVVEENEAPAEEEQVVEETEAPAEEEQVVEETEAPAEEEQVVEETEAPAEEQVVEETEAPAEEEQVVEETEAPAEEELVVEKIEDLTDDEEFDEGYVRFLKEGRLYLEDKGDEYALDAAKGSVAFALSRPNAGKETDRLLVVLSVDGEAFEGYVDAKRLLPLSDEDVMKLQAELDGEDVVCVDDDDELPLPAARVTLKPVEDDEAAEEIEIMLPVESETEEDGEEAADEEENTPVGLPVGGLVAVIPEADDAEEEAEEETEEEADEPVQEEIGEIGLGGQLTVLPDSEEETAPVPVVSEQEDKPQGDVEYKAELTEEMLNLDLDMSTAAGLPTASFSKGDVEGKGYTSGTFTNVKTSHPYYNNEDYGWYIDLSNDDEWGLVSCVALYFDANTYFEKGKDYLLFYDYRGKLIKKYTGDELAGRQLVIPGNEFYIRYITNSSRTYYGFEIDKFYAYNEPYINYSGTNEKGKPIIGWEEAFPKQGYEVWRAQFNTSTGYLMGDYKKVKSGTGKFEYVDSSAKNGCAYSYLLRLYATVGGKKFYTYAVRTDAYALKAPTVTSTEVRKSGSKYYVDLKWKAVDGAQEYYVYRYNDPDDQTATVFPVSGYRTSFTDTSISAEGTYIYNVVAGGPIGGEMVRGGWSANQYALCNEAEIIIDSSDPNCSSIDNKGYVVLNWKENDYAPGMRIDRAKIDAKTGKVGSFSKVVELDSGTTYTDKKAKAGNAYVYRLRNYVKEGKAKFYSLEGQFSVVVPQSTTITGTGAVADASFPMINLKWKAAKNATYYRLYRAEMGSADFELVSNVYSTSYTDYPDEFAMYQYAVQPVVSYNESLYAAPLSPIKVYGYPSAPAGLMASGVSGKKVTLEWNAVEGATGYYIYRNNTQYGTYKRIGVSKTAKYTDTKAKVGQQNYYLVTSYVKVGKKTIESENVAPISIYPMPAPKLTAVKRNSTTVMLNWNAVDYAQGYEVYVSTNQNGPFTRLGTTGYLAAEVGNLDPLTEYVYFYVRAYRKDGSVTSYSEESAVKSVLMNKINYRAILIGQNDYIDNALQGPENDSLAMAKMLGTMSKTKYSITRVNNLTAHGIDSQLSKVFSQADGNDVTLFYYSGHGSNTGALVGIDNTTISPDTLRQILDQYVGKKIVIIDACYSGNMIGKSVDDFNDSFVSAFSKKTKANLAAQDYYVMTACSKSQLSTESTLGSKKRVGVFTNALLYGCGWNQTGSKKLSKLYSDTNGDKAITLKEAYNYTVARVDYLGDLNKLGGFDQDAKVYPTNSSQKLFSR